MDALDMGIFEIYAMFFWVFFVFEKHIKIFILLDHNKLAIKITQEMGASLVYS